MVCPTVMTIVGTGVVPEECLETNTNTQEALSRLHVLLSSEGDQTNANRIREAQRNLQSLNGNFSFIVCREVMYNIHTPTILQTYAGNDAIKRAYVLALFCVFRDINSTVPTDGPMAMNFAIIAYDYAEDNCSQYLATLDHTYSDFLHYHFDALLGEIERQIEHELLATCRSQLAQCHAELNPPRHGHDEAGPDADAQRGLNNLEGGGCSCSAPGARSFRIQSIFRLLSRF